MARLLLIALISALLLWIAWPPLPFAGLLFIAFLPLLYVEDELAKSDSPRSSLKFLLITYLTFLAWNLLTTWWVWNASPEGSIAAFVLNSLLMSVPVYAFHKTRKYYGDRAGYLSFVAYFTAFEYVHLSWEFTWPWLTIGNGLAMHPSMMQWYEYTGHLGGTVWILGMNVLLYMGLKSFYKWQGILQSRFKWEGRKNQIVAASISFLKPVLFFAVPLFISHLIYTSYKEKGKPVNVTVVQPNVDPYNEKFSRETMQSQLDTLISLSKRGMRQDTRYIVWPETSVPGRVLLNKPSSSFAHDELVDFQRETGKTLVVGATGTAIYDEAVTATARYYQDGDCCFDIFNSAIQIDGREDWQFYHKSKLVPGVERMPYPGFFKFLEPLAIDLGGITGSLGIQEERSVFFTPDSLGVAPVICYESVFGSYLSEYVTNGANAIFIITNDGWWGNTPGYKQHLYYASMRAIENRRSIARSANTGVSCFINQRGDISQATGYWVPAVINETIAFNDELTFFTQYGDYIGRVAAFVSVFLLLATFIKRKTARTVLK